jgi:hypothetical protein
VVRRGGERAEVVRRKRGRSCRMEKVRKRYPCLWKVAIG